MGKIRAAIDRLKTIDRRKLYYFLYGLASGLFFLWALFPSEDFADYLETVVSKNGDGMTVTIEKARPTLTLGVVVKDAVISNGSSTNVEAAYLYIRPGYISLFGNNPSVFFKAEVFGGKIKGKMRWDKKSRGGNGKSFEKLTLTDIDLSRFKKEVKGFMPKVAIEGILNADGGYTSEGRGNGLLNLTIKNLTIRPAEPFFTIESLSFDDVTAAMDIKNKKMEIENCVIEGKDVDGSMKGSIFLREPFDRSTLRLAGGLKLEKGLIDKLSANMPIEAVLGGGMDEDGELPFTVSGMIGSPRYSLSK